jgi:hypothetical protein
MNRPIHRETFADPFEAVSRRHVDDTSLAELIIVLTAAPAGLRRWSVMRAMRKLAERHNREIAPKFENDVERVFRFYCENADGPSSNEKFFYRPKEKAGDVWAVHCDRAKTWLDRNDHGALLDVRPR